MKERIHNILNKDIKKYDVKLLLSMSFLFIFLVGIVSYLVANNKSFALFTDEVNGSKTIAIHYEDNTPMTTLYTDGTLIINEKASDRASNITAHGAVTNEYDPMKTDGTDIEKYIFTSASQRPWNPQKSSVKSVKIGQYIKPTSTAYWFYQLYNMRTGDFTNLDTQNVTSMLCMFDQAGSTRSVTSFVLIGLDNWDTSKVTTMQTMFSEAGYYATTFDTGDLSNWDTSSVTGMQDMFSYAGFSATTWNIGNLSNWNTSKVTNMSSMFNSAGYSSTTFNIDVSDWDVSKVESMSSLFSQAGQNATTWSIGDLSSWDTSNVTNMSVMFNRAGYNATTWNIGNLSNWNTSSVTTMSGMFKGSGYKATTWSIGNLSSWNTSNVTNMNGMFSQAGKTATTWNSIGTLKVYATSIARMFYDCPKGNATLNVYSNPDNYTDMFWNAATANGALITVNYSSTTTNIDDMVATGYQSGGNVVKGNLIS